MNAFAPRVRGLFLGIAAGAIFVSAGFAGYAMLSSTTKRAPDFSLTDQDGRTFTLSQERGHPAVLFFGYTHCPDACPLTLANLTRALHETKLDDEARVLFVSVDPRRDTGPVLKRYLDLFDSRYVGLTGPPAAIESVEKAYHTWSQPLPVSGRGTDYTVAHGAATYFIDRGGMLRGLGSWNDGSASVARDLRKYFS